MFRQCYVIWIYFELVLALYMLALTGPFWPFFWAYSADLVAMLDLCRTYIWQLSRLDDLLKNIEKIRF